MSKFRIFGRVVNRNSGRGMEKLRVEVWDKDVKNDDLCGTAITNKKGDYQVIFDESAFQDNYKDVLPDIYFKIFKGEELLQNTIKKVRKNFSPGDTEINFELDVPEDSKDLTQSPVTTKPKKSVLLATGLEDYGRWQAMFQDHQPAPNEPPFRRGRIWS